MSPNDLGIDRSGNGNNWTVNNMTYSDQMLDTPTNNFATLNALAFNSLALSEGNLKATASGGGQECTGTLMPQTGKWYYELYLQTFDGGNEQFGITRTTAVIGSTYLQGINYRTDGYKFVEGTSTSGYGATWTTGDILSAALDLDANTIIFYKNNVSQGSLSFTTGYDMTPMIRMGGSGDVVVMNFGSDSSFAGNKTAQGNQDSNEIGDFYYTPPSGFLALCTANLPEPAVKPSQHFNPVIWSGDGNHPRTISGVGFQPDLNWIKLRSGTDSHHIFDAVRGAGERIMSDSTSAEESSSAHTAFTSDGFTISDNGAVNGSGSTYVAWNWKAGGSGSSNTDGSITSTVSANQDAGFSIVSYTGNGSDGATIGHGLSKAPEMVIFKDRDASVNWAVMGYPTHPAYSTDGNMLFLNLTEAQGNSESNEISLGASTITLVDSGPLLGTSGNDYIAYCFHSVEGFSRCGKYEGNGSTDGVYVHLGFCPMWIMIKRTSTTSDWAILDSARGFNSEWEQLSANESDAEGGFDDRIDFVSNGFKTRASSFPNGSSVEFIYLAFAEQPFKHTNAK